MSLGLAIAAGLSSVPANAVAINTVYVNQAIGTDASPCALAAPCATLNFALQTVAVGGSVNIIGPGIFGPIIITAAISISGNDPSNFVVIQASGDPAGCVNAAAGTCGTYNGFAVDLEAGTNDVVKIAHLGMATTGSGTGALKVGSGNVISLTNDIFRGNSTTSGPIVNIVPGGSGSTQIYMSNGDVAFNQVGGAVLVAPTGANNARLHFNHMEVHHAGYGIRTDASGLSSGNGVNTFVSESEFFSFGGSAVTALSITGAGYVNSVYNQVNVLNTNGPAVNANGPGSLVILTNSTLGGNQTGVRSINNANVISSVNNTIEGNGQNISTSAGGTFTPTPLQ